MSIQRWPPTRVLACLLVSLASGATFAQPDHPLAGPAVPDQVARTLVNFDARGRFQRLDSRPEEAAIALLDLDAERRDRVAAAVGAYAASLGTLLIDNIDTVKESTDSLAAGDNAKVQDLARQLYDKFDEDHTRDPLAKPLAEILNMEEQADFARLVDGYWDAWIDWELRNAKDKSDEARRKTEGRLAFSLFQQEVRRAYERTLQPFRTRLENIFRIAEPTEEQRAAIRTLVIEYIRETRLSPTPEQRQKLARGIYEALDDERRIKLLERAIFEL